MRTNIAPGPAGTSPAGEVAALLPKYRHMEPPPKGRKDKYADEYMGVEYEWAADGPALEVMTTAVQWTFHDYGYLRLAKFMRDDPEMLNLTLALLFRYDP